MHSIVRYFIIVLLLTFFSCRTTSSETETQLNFLATKSPDYQEYMSFFEEVYKTMEENYYRPVTREDFNKFLYLFNTKIYSQLKGSGKSSNFVKWRSAAFLVDALKSSEDIFSAFFPPKPAKEFEQKVLGKKVDLGIEGMMTPEGYLVTRMQIRADGYEKGLRDRDLIVALNKKAVLSLKEEEIQELLNPLEGETVAIEYYDSLTHAKHEIDVVSKEYFKQFVYMIPVDVPNVYCLQIEKFNRMTAEDLTRYMTYILQQGDTSLIIDLRENPGGPPLAAQEISAFFLPPKEEFAYFQKRDQPKSELFVPEIPPPYRYKGDIVILVNEQSGSASELFSGILQRRGRATIMGTNTAGQVFLKHMFSFADESMVLLVIARGYHPDGTVFSFNGVEPNEKVEKRGRDLIQYAAEYLLAKRRARQ